MITARLTDHIWSTRKAESLNGLKLMQAEIIGGGTDTGKKIIVVDIISAGIGDRVVVTTGSSARRMLGDDNMPVDAVGVASDGDDLDGHRAVLAEGKLAVVVEVQLSQRAHRRQRQQQRKEGLEDREAYFEEQMCGDEFGYFAEALSGKEFQWV